MGGKVGDVMQALAALQQARAGLATQLESEPAWQAMCQLDAREASGHPVVAIDAEALRARLTAHLDEAAPAWRSMKGLDAAIAALTAAPLAKLYPAEDRGGSHPVDPPPSRNVRSLEEPKPEQERLKQPPRVRHAVPASPSSPADPLGSAAEAHNRTLAEAIAAIQALDASTTAPAIGVVPLPQNVTGVTSAIGDDASPRTILGRIRSADGKPLPSASEPEPQSNAPNVPHPPAAPLRATPMPSPATALPIDASARIAKVERELDGLMRSSIATRNPASLAEDRETEIVDDFDEALYEEAAVQIVTSGKQNDGDFPGESIGHERPTRERGRERADRSSWVPKVGQRDTSSEPGSYAAYDGIIDEASVEIVQLDEPEPTPARGAKDASGNPA